METAPRPAAETDSGRVVEDVTNDGVEVALVGDDSRLEAALEEVSGAVVAAVEAHRVQAVQALHPPRELGLRRLNQQVEMVVEQDPGVNLPAKATLDLDEQFVPGLAVKVIEDDRPLLDATADHVVPGGTRQLRAWNPRHADTLVHRNRSRNRRKGTCPRDSPSDLSFADGPFLVTARASRFRADCG